MIPATETIAAALSGTALDTTLLGVAGIAVAVAAFIVLRRMPRTAVGVWIAVLCFVPVWIGLSLGFNGNYYLPAVSGMAVLATVVLLPVHGFRFGAMDGLVALLIVFAFASLITANAGIALGFAFSLFTYFIAGYVFGRVAGLRVDPSWIYGAVAIAFTVVSVLVIVEFLAHWNPFVTIRSGNSMYAVWGTIQERGGVARAEGAFGHSIALGSSLAIAIPLTLAARFPLLVRAGMVLLMLSATVLTFSRIGMIGALLGLVLSIVFMRDAISRRARIVLTSAIAIVSALLFPLVATVFDDAGAEATGSANYRGDLLSLLGSMNAVGVAGSAQKNSTGQVYFGNFRSIDSQLILTGLSSGLIALAVVVVALGAGIVLVVTRRATPATIAVVAQIPALATVALITQYSVFLWVAVGLAATTQHVRPATAEANLLVSSDRYRRARPPVATTAPLPERSAR
ncbi:MULTISPECIES: hypothetical protein [unclassified Leifsonia]|uniref:hypothetical protein n=1 Tax=unclassified Leifsonia TaxID=2663824 RepID=UPI0008A7ECE6|nr:MULTISPECIES: hypothetical protein [unclassified Leifsonia]SEI02362.1 hypothetical protein SAMN04515694_11064 [Leifsonia sp. CL154]SFL71168.1 hypothetical protein SAMN04515692_11064 [Leifsonia sp. CL147]